MSPHATRGLTLLEVLAATLIFALVMTTLIGTSSSLVHRTALAAARLEAAEQADAVVAELEIQMRTGIAPTLEPSEWPSEDGQYVVRVLNRTIQEALSAPATTAADEAAIAAGGPAPDSPGATRVGGSSGIGTLLAGQLPEAAKHLRQYDVEVSWTGPSGPESVTRTTFAFDWQAAKIEFASLFEAAGGGPEGDGAEAGRGDPNDAGGGTPSLEAPSPISPRGAGRRPR